MAKSKVGAGPDAPVVSGPVVAGPVVAGPVVPLVTAGRTGVDPSLTGKDRRRSEKAATAAVKPRKLRALTAQLDALVTDAAELGLHLAVDRDALATLAAERSTPAPAGAPAQALKAAAPTS